MPLTADDDGRRRQADLAVLYRRRRCRCDGRGDRGDRAAASACRRSTCPGVGRMAMVADPQGIPSTSCAAPATRAAPPGTAMGMGKCNWNELTTPDQAAPTPSTPSVFGWTYPDKMPMGEMGDYVFVEAAGQTIGATMTGAQDGPPPGVALLLPRARHRGDRRQGRERRRHRPCRPDGGARRRPHHRRERPAGRHVRRGRLGQPAKRAGRRETMTTARSSPACGSTTAQAREAAEFYAATFPDSRVGSRRGLARRQPQHQGGRRADGRVHRARPVRSSA